MPQRRRSVHSTIVVVASVRQFDSFSCVEAIAGVHLRLWGQMLVVVHVAATRSVWVVAARRASHREECVAEYLHQC